MHSNKYVLDGVKNGIGAFIRSRKAWIKGNDGKSELFTNFRTLNARLKREPELDYHDVSFWFRISDPVTGDVVISLNEALKVDYGWRVIRKNENIHGMIFDHVYCIEETEFEVVTNLGYITDIHTGESGDGSDKFRYSKLKNIRSSVIEAAKGLCEINMYAVSNISTPYGTDLRIDNTTATIHIWQISKQMNYNTNITKSRENDTAINNGFGIKKRVLPYLKEADKYGSLYIFSTCERSDLNDPVTNTKIEQIMSILISYANDLYPEKQIKFDPVEFHGILKYEKEVINNDYKNS